MTHLLYYKYGIVFNKKESFLMGDFTSEIVLACGHLLDWVLSKGKRSVQC